MKKILTIIGLICFFILTVEAVTVTKTVNISNPGTLQSLLTENEIQTLTDLTPIGSIDARDIFFIRDNLPVLKRLDMSGSTIAECSVVSGSMAKKIKKVISYKMAEIIKPGLLERPDQNISANIKKSPAETIIYPANTIPEDGFSNATTIESIILPTNLTTIDRSAFFNTSFQTINLPNTLTTIGNWAFQLASVTSLNLPASATNISDGAFYEMFFNMGFTVNNANSAFSSLGGVLYSKDGTRLVAYPLGKSENTFSILSPVSVIGSYAFYGENDLISIYLPNTLDSIGDFAFGDCVNLSTLPFPPSLKALGRSIISNTDIMHANLSGCTLMKKIGEFAFQSANINQFSLPSSVTSIDRYAFSLCPILSEVNLSGYQQLQILGDWSFWSCENLSKITLSSYINSIGYCFIYDCSTLTDIIVPEGNPLFSSLDGNLYNKNQSVLVYYSPGKPEIAFDVPESVTTIGEASISGCQNLMNVSTGSALQRVGWSAFFHCDTLQAILLNSTSLTTIENHAFEYDHNLKILQVRSSTPPTLGGSNAFDLIDLTQCFLVVPSGTKTTYQATDYWNHFYNIEEGIAYKTKTINASTPGALYTKFNIFEKPAICTLTITGSIDARDFVLLRDEMPCLTNLDLSGATIAQYTGSNGPSYVPSKRTISSKNRIYKPKGHLHATNANLDKSESESIAPDVRKAPASSLASVYYPANEIPEYAFINPDTWDYKGTLQSVLLPAGLKGIGEEAFALTNITSMNFPNSLTFIGDYAFENSSMKSFNLPASLNKLGYLPFYCSLYNAGFSVPETNTAFSSQDGVLFSKNKSLLIAYPLSKSATSYSIPSTVTAIDTCAFYTESELTDVYFPTSLQRIGYSAFEETGIRNLDLSACNQLSKIELWAFASTGLTTLLLPASINTIEEYAFCYNPKLTSVDLTNCSSLTEIGNYAFCDDYNMDRISLPVSLNSDNMGYGLFVDCWSLTEILVPEGSIYLTSYQGNLYNKNKKTFVSYATGKPDPLFVLPESVTKINDYAFNGSGNLGTISTGSKVDTILYRAFSFCDNLQKLSINGTAVKYMDELSVGYDPSLRLLQINSAIPPTLESYVFEGTDQESCELNVPVGAVSAYNSALQWSDFYRLTEYSFTELTPESINQIFLPTLVTETFKPEGLTGIARMFLIDPSGKTVLSTQIYGNESVSLAHFPKGLYFVKIITDDGEQVIGKIVKM